MIASLTDLCLKSICYNLTVLHGDVRGLLPTIFKETLLERLADHDLFKSEYLPYVEKALFVPELKTLNFSTCQQVDDDFLERLSQCGCKLRSMCLGGSVSTDGIVKFLNKQNKLIELKLFGSILDLAFLEKVKIPSLRKVALKIYGCKYSNGYSCCPELPKSPLRCLVPFVTNNASLRDFALSCDPSAMFLGDSYISEIITVLGENLERFQIDGLIPVPPACIQAVADHCPNIRVLKLESYLRSKGIKPSAVKQLTDSCPRLEILKLSSMDHCGDSGLSTVCFPSKLNCLSLSPRVDDKPVPLPSSELITLIHLERLEVPMWYFTPYTVYTLLSKIGGQLREINFLDTRLKNQDKMSECAVVEAVVKYCSNVESLGLCCHHVESLDRLMLLFTDSERADSLCRFRLSCDKLVLEDSHAAKKAKMMLAALANSCENLRELDIDSRFVDDTILVKLAKNCPKLCKLVLHPAGRRHVYNSKISDIALCELATRCPLEEVSLIESLRYCNITSLSLNAFANCCPSLQSLSFSSDCKFSSKDLKKLKGSCISRVSIKIMYAASVLDTRDRITL